MPNQIILATTNPGKLREMKEVLEVLPVELLIPSDLGETLEVEETGATFTENALLKARAYVEHFGVSAIADDGGIEIDAFGGEPGVYSRRWPGYHATDEELIGYTLGRMYGIAPEKRRAQLRAVSVYLEPQGTMFQEEGILRGVIGEKPSPRREAGYPFRPIFFIPEVGKYSIDMTPEEHEVYNQRRDMLRRLKARLMREIFFN